MQGRCNSAALVALGWLGREDAFKLNIMFCQQKVCTMGIDISLNSLASRPVPFFFGDQHLQLHGLGLVTPWLRVVGHLLLPRWLRCFRQRPSSGAFRRPYSIASLRSSCRCSWTHSCSEFNDQPIWWLLSAVRPLYQSLTLMIGDCHCPNLGSDASTCSIQQSGRFRMHPKLCAFPAAAFYGNQLKTSGVTAELVALEFRGSQAERMATGFHVLSMMNCLCYPCNRYDRRTCIYSSISSLCALQSSWAGNLVTCWQMLYMFQHVSETPVAGVHGPEKQIGSSFCNASEVH